MNKKLETTRKQGEGEGLRGGPGQPVVRRVAAHGELGLGGQQSVELRLAEGELTLELDPRAAAAAATGRHNKPQK